MVRKIIHDPLLLAQKSTPATSADLQLVADLVDTLSANMETCAGIAANMIGALKNIIAVNCNGIPVVMLNPVILAHSGRYDTEEGCLSMTGTRKCVRWLRIKVKYQDAAFRWHEQTYSDWLAEVIQHEIDHCNGILI